MARRVKKGAAQAAAPGSIFVWIATPTGRQLVSRRRAAAMGLTIDPVKQVAADSDEETPADDRTESADVVETDGGTEPTVVETEATERTTTIDTDGDAPAVRPMTTRKAGGRSKSTAKSTRSRSRKA